MRLGCALVGGLHLLNRAMLGFSRVPRSAASIMHALLLSLHHGPIL